MAKKIPYLPPLPPLHPHGPAIMLAMLADVRPCGFVKNFLRARFSACHGTQHMQQFSIGPLPLYSTRRGFAARALKQKANQAARAAFTRWIVETPFPAIFAA